MTIQFKKGKGKASTLKCIREDGSTAWTKMPQGIEIHDLAHYVVETELQFSEAFFGLISRGYSVDDFEIPRSERPVELIPANLPVQALQTEHLVNLLMISYRQGDSSLDVPEALRSILAEHKIPYPLELDRRSLDRIFEQLQQLVEQWEGLLPGESLKLEFTYGGDQVN